MTDMPSEPSSELTTAVVGLQTLQEMIVTVTATVSGVCRRLREGGVPEEAITPFAARLLDYLGDLMFGAKP